MLDHPVSLDLSSLDALIQLVKTEAKCITESTFLIRVSERGISFTEADGGMWKLTARMTIKKYLEEALRSEVEAGEVVIAL